MPKPYLANGDSVLIERLGYDMHKGITVSCSGFYAPQGRVLRYDLARKDLIPSLTSFSFRGKKITNFEMETGAIYGLSRVLGHKCCSVNAIVANRINKTHTLNLDKVMDELILKVLERI